MKIIIDVRTREEFNSGHIEGSKNIPIQEILSHVEEIKALSKAKRTDPLKNRLRLQPIWKVAEHEGCDAFLIYFLK